MNDVGNHYWRICRGNKSWRLSPPVLSGDRVCDAPILKDWQCFCCGIGLSRPLALHGSRGLSDLVCIMSHSDRSLWRRLRSSSGEPKLSHLRFFCFFCRRGQHSSSRTLSYGRARQDHRGLVATAFCDCAAFARSTGIAGVSGETWPLRAWARLRVTSGNAMCSQQRRQRGAQRACAARHLGVRAPVRQEVEHELEEPLRRVCCRHKCLPHKKQTRRKREDRH